MFKRQHRWQYLVFHPDPFGGLLGDTERDRRHRRHRMALVENLFPRQDVAGEIPVVHPTTLPSCPSLVGKVGQVRAGDDRLHTGNSGGFGEVDRENPGVGVGTAQHRSLEHPRRGEIGSEAGPAGDLVESVVTYRAGSHPFVAGAGCGHVSSFWFSGSLIRAAASRIERTILSYPVHRHRFPATP